MKRYKGDSIRLTGFFARKRKQQKAMPSIDAVNDKEF
jgi:hypothetical protein